MKKFLLAVMLVLTVSCLMSFSTCTKTMDELSVFKAAENMTPTNVFTVTVLPDGQHKIDWSLNGDGRTIRSYNIIYYYKNNEQRILTAAIRLTDTPQFPNIPPTGTLTWNPWAGNKHRKITYDGTICVFSSTEDPTQSDCYYGDPHVFQK